MDIAALSTVLSMQQYQQAVSVNLLKKTMDQAADSFLSSVEALNEANPVSEVPSFGHILDVKA